MRDETRRHSGNEAICLQSLLSRARDQEGVDQVWSLTVASQVLRERQASPGPLDWVDRQLRSYMDNYAKGHEDVASSALIDTLADLAQDFQ